MIEHLFEKHGTYYRINAFVPGRQTLVFVHGASGSSSAWASYEARFDGQFNLLTYDLRGHGKSRKYPRYDDYAVPRFVEDLKALLEHLSIDQCVLVSHSFGVLIALEFLRAHQSSVLGAVLVSPDFDIGRTLPAKVLKALLTPVPAWEYLPFRPRAGRRIDYTQYPNTGDWDIPRIWADVGNTTWRVYWFCARAAFEVHARSLLAEIRVPVRLLHGGRDTIFPVQNSFDMAARIPEADLIVFPDANHIIVLNHPVEVGDAIESFTLRLR